MEKADAVAASASGPAGARAWRPGHVPRGLRPYLVLTAVSLLIALYLTWRLLGGMGQRMIAGNPDDVRLFEWYLEHGPQAVLHGRNPLYFTTMNAPAGVNAMWNTSLLFPALLLAPVTLLAGPLAAYNVAFIAGLAAGPVCAFPLMRRFAARDWAAAAGALAFGFSPAVLAAGLGHLDLALIALMPLMMVIVYDLAAGRRRVLTGGIALGLLATAELFTSEEVLFQAGLAIMIALVLLAVTAPRLITAAGAARLARGLGVALGVFAVLSGAALWLQLRGPLHQHGSPFTLSYFEADLRGFYLPSHMFWLSTPGSSAFAAGYGGGPAEYLAYLGIPLLAVAMTTGLLRIGDWRARVLLGTGLLFAVFSLGGTLLDGGRQTGVRLPWGIAEHWPLFGNALPDRFAFVVALAAAGLLALAVDWMAGAGGQPPGRWPCCSPRCAWPRWSRAPTRSPRRRRCPRSSPPPAAGCPPGQPCCCCPTRPPPTRSRSPGRRRPACRSGCRAGTSSARRRAARRSSAGLARCRSPPP